MILALVKAVEVSLVLFSFGSTERPGVEQSRLLTILLSHCIATGLNHRLDDVLCVLEAFDHLVIGRVERLLQRQSLSRASSVHVTYEPTITAQNNLRVVLEAHLNDFVIETE